MTRTGDWPVEETPPTRVTALPDAERRVLAALAVVGSASLSAEELAELAEVDDDVTPLVADLEQHGLIRREEKQRYSVLDRIGEEIRQTDAALSAGDRLLKYMTTLAKDGQLTPERLLDDAEAVLGLTEWAAEMQQWKRLLELVKTLQACFGIAHRVEEWLTLLDRARSAARALGDRRSEVWALQQLAAASSSVGDPAAARRYLREADKLRRWRPSIPRRGARSDEDASGGPQGATVGGGTARTTWWMLGSIVAAVAGGATGYAIGHNNGGVSPTTTQVPVSVTVGGKAVTTFKRVTLPATTVLNTKTVTATTTVYKTTPPITSEAELRTAPRGVPRVLP
ncbi:MAG TPA: hypothetical protein VGG98_09015 [Solirubrobacteraceae bacterium]|jgi:DNA-binding MarR family transcriptional regulator